MVHSTRMTEIDGKGLNYNFTNILDKIRPGINPARTGTSAVASDQVKTPISRTFLQQ